MYLYKYMYNFGILEFIKSLKRKTLKAFIGFTYISIKKENKKQ